MSLRTFVSRWVPVIAWMVLIFAGSTDALSAQQTSRFLVPFLYWLDPHISFATIAAIHVSIRKLGHLTEYAILAALLWRAIRTLTFGRAWMPAVLSLGIAACYAALDEFHQSFVPTRTASDRDVAIDIMGAAVGIAICLLLARKRAAA